MHRKFFFSLLIFSPEEEDKENDLSENNNNGMFCFLLIRTHSQPSIREEHTTTLLKLQISFMMRAGLGKMSDEGGEDFYMELLLRNLFFSILLHVLFKIK